MTQWKYLPDQHCYSALHEQYGLRVQKRNGAWQWFAERLAIGGGCEIISGSSQTRAAALLAAIDAADRSGET